MTSKQAARSRWGWMAWAMLGVVACIPKYEQPEVRLNTVRLGALGLRGGTVYATLVVTNPNSFALRTFALAYAIEMNSATTSAASYVPLASGTLDREVSIAAHDSALVEVPVDFTYDGVGSALRSILRSGTLDYRLSGDLQVLEPLRRRIPFRHNGTVNLASRP
jgi:LEA14-like dessication related protein